ncbi:Uncharacterised protein [Bordetella trematum]|nr:Uncharacterised protein [Bordetella trematum]
MSHHTFSLLLRRCIAGAMLAGLAAQAHAQQVVVGATAPLTGPCP